MQKKLDNWLITVPKQPGGNFHTSRVSLVTERNIFHRHIYDREESSDWWRITSRHGLAFGRISLRGEKMECGQAHSVSRCHPCLINSSLRLWGNLDLPGSFINAHQLRNFYSWTPWTSIKVLTKSPVSSEFLPLYKAKGRTFWISGELENSGLESVRFLDSPNRTCTEQSLQSDIDSRLYLRSVPR